MLSFSLIVHGIYYLHHITKLILFKFSIENNLNYFLLILSKLIIPKLLKMLMS